MKIIFSIVLCVICLMFVSVNLYGQTGKVTIILLRHAEKDTSATASRSNPDLTAEGKQRAQRLVEVLRKYKPDLIYSTDYTRTRATILPLAETVDADYRIPVRIYNFDKLEEFSSELLKSNARTIVVVGHNTTTPELANLLVKQQKYKALGDDEYDKIWIVEVKRNRRKSNKVKEKIIKY